MTTASALPGYDELIEHVASKMTGKDLAMFVLSHVQARESEGKQAGELIVEEMAKAFDADLVEIRKLRAALQQIADARVTFYSGIAREALAAKV